jgi:hypothetical protein
MNSRGTNVPLRAGTDIRGGCTGTRIFGNPSELYYSIISSRPKLISKPPG